MRSFTEIQHPIPIGEHAFQSFCLKLARRYWDDDLADLHGRSGQKQDGIDIRGSDKRRNLANVAMQCKGSESHEPRILSEAEIRTEIEKAKKLSPQLNSLIIAYAGKRDAVLQNLVKTLNDANVSDGLFEIVLWPWETIVARAADFPDIAQELLVLNNVPFQTQPLDPKRPTSGVSTSGGTRVETAFLELKAALLEGQSSEDLGDPVAQGKIDVWRDQINAGNGSAAIKPLRDFVATLPGGGHSRVRFRAYANLGAALTAAREYESAAIAFDEAAAAEQGSAEGHAYAARAALSREQPHTAHVRRQHP